MPLRRDLWFAPDPDAVEFLPAPAQGVRYDNLYFAGSSNHPVLVSHRPDVGPDCAQEVLRDQVP
jgi:hypothetical protein